MAIYYRFIASVGNIKLYNMAEQKRLERINELIKRELGNIILEEMNFDGALVTITDVKSAGNLQTAKVYIATIPTEQDKEVMHRLSNAVFHLQQLLNHRLKMRPVPKIIWQSDLSGDKLVHLENVLLKVEKELDKDDESTK